MGEDGAIGKLDEAVDDALRMDDHLDLIEGQVEKPHGLHHFETLVHERRRVDGDLAAHRPGRVRERLVGFTDAQLSIPLIILAIVGLGIGIAVSGDSDSVSN